MTTAAVGSSSNRRPGAAGRAAAEQAIAQLPNGKADAIIVFATTGYRQDQLLSAVREVVGNTPLAGCSAEGVITRNGSDEGTSAVAVMAIASECATFQTFHVSEYSKDAVACATQIAERVGAAGQQNAKLLLLFPDGRKGRCTEMLRSLDERLPFPITVCGGTAGTMLNAPTTTLSTFQYFDGVVADDSIAALLIGGNVAADVAVSHGCEPIGIGHVVTRSDGASVYEIDGRAAWSVLCEYLNDDPRDLAGVDLVHLCIGENLPETDAQRYGAQIIRTPLAYDASNGSLFFPGGLAQGARIQMTRRDPDRVRESALGSARALAARSSKASLMLQFDCAGRGRVLFGEQINQSVIAPMQDLFPKTLPWLGFHTFGEIAQLGAGTRFHNYTVALCALSDV